MPRHDLLSGPVFRFFSYTNELSALNAASPVSKCVAKLFGELFQLQWRFMVHWASSKNTDEIIIISATQHGIILVLRVRQTFGVHLLWSEMRDPDSHLTFTYTSLIFYPFFSPCHTYFTYLLLLDLCERKQLVPGKMPPPSKHMQILYSFIRSMDVGGRYSDRYYAHRQFIYSIFYSIVRCWVKC